MVWSSLSVTVGIAAAGVMSPACEVEVCPGRDSVGTARCPVRGSPTPDDDSTQRHMPSEQGDAGVGSAGENCHHSQRSWVAVSLPDARCSGAERVVVRCGNDSDGEQRTEARSAHGEGARGGQPSRGEGDPASARRSQASAIRWPGDHDRRQHPRPVAPDVGRGAAVAGADRIHGWRRPGRQPGTDHRACPQPRRAGHPRRRDEHGVHPRTRGRHPGPSLPPTQ